MINILEKIGKLVRNDKVGRIKYHPLIKKFILDNGTIKNNNKKINYTCYSIDLDIDHQKIKCIDEVPMDEIYVLKYDKGGNVFPYIIGNYEYINKGKLKFNTLDKCFENIKNLKIDNDIFNKFATTLHVNIDIFSEILKNIELNDGIFIKFLINGKEFFEYDEIMDVIDETYMSDITIVKNENIILTNSLFGFFNTNETISQTPNFNYDESFKSLFLTKDRLKNLIYSVKFHTTSLKTIVDDYKFIYLPDYDGLTYEVLDKFFNRKFISINDEMNNKDKIENNNNNISIDTLLTSGFEDMNEEDKKKVVFCLVFKLNGGQTTNDLTIIKNFSLSKLESLNTNIQNINKELDLLYPYNIKNAFIKFFKLNKTKDSGPYSNKIYKWVVDYFNNKYENNILLDKMLIKKIEYLYRNSEQNELLYGYNDIVKNYKFLKYMEKNGKQKEEFCMNSDSYKLGFELGVFSQVWQKERKNIKSYVMDYCGNISKRIKNINDVIKYYNTIEERLIRNKCYYDRRNISKEFEIFDNNSSKFDKDFFIKGFFDGLNKRIKTEETDTDIVNDDKNKN